MMYRLAGGVRITVAGRDGIIEQAGKAALVLPGEGARLRTLALLLRTPRPEDWLRIALARRHAQPAPGDLVGRLVAEQVLVPWDLGPRLAELHRQTTGPSEWPAVNPGLEAGRLLREFTGEGALTLPPPSLEKARLADALRARRSVRRFGAGPFTTVDLATLLALGAGCGDTDAVAALLVPGGPPAGRTYPSGGALYPVDVLAYPLRVEAVPSGFYSYQALPHRLVPVAPAQPPDTLAGWLPNHPIAEASVLLLLSVDFARPSLGKYGERAYRLALLEAGHLAQNVLLVAAALGRAGLPICGFDDERLSVAAGLAFPNEAVVYILALGTPLAPGTD
jgi:SagB-type dehydrogenase family enzyme